MTPVDKFIRQHTSWETFFVALTALPNKVSGAAPDKGKVFERLTQLYLKTNPEYQTKLREVWIAHVDLPPRIRAALNLPHDDEGIDLVAVTFAGEFWAIQCKFRSDTSGALTVKELSTFTNLCFNFCRDISLAVVAHTCSKPVRKHQLLGNTTEIGLQRWLEIYHEDWRRIHAATTRPAPPPVRRKPREHQKAAIKAAKTYFLEGNATRGKLLMPCGTGKSLTAFWIAHELKAQSIVVAVPSLSLIKQSLLDWTSEFLAHGEVPEWLCVCSDETTGNLDRDEFVSEVYELGVDATTDVGVIGRFLTANNGKRKIVFTTYQSGKVLAEAAKRSSFGFDLGIMDEAHRTVGARDKVFSHLVSSDNIPITRRIFMTATERITRGSDDEVLSMDDAATYGDCFYQLSFKQAIEANPPIISNYRILTITVNDAHVHELIAHNRYLTTPDRPMDEREAQSLAAGIALQRAFAEYGVKHAISFHRSIRAAKEFRTQHEQIVSAGKANPATACFHVSSQETTGERARILQQFVDAPSAIITNARCLQEGVDIPAVDCVLFADPKQSVVDIVQAAGRAMRPYPGKRFGYIVIPIVVPTDMDFDTFAETTEFRRVASVITALSTQDGRIAEEFRITEGRPRKGGRIVEISGDVPTSYRIDFEEFRQKIQTKLWQRVGRANWRGFEEAKKYVHGLFLPNQKAWLAYCRSKKLPPDIPSDPSLVYRHAGWTLLNDWLGYGSRFIPWDERYRELIAYKKINGNCNVSKLDPKNKELGGWVSEQRTLLRRGKLDKSRKAWLDELEFVWNILGKNWEMRFSELSQFQREKRHCRVPYDWPENRGLSRWVGTQRTDKTKGRLTPEKASRLTEIGFDWNRTESDWEENFSALSKFFRQERHLKIPEKWAEQPGLRRWVNKQREDYKKGTLLEESIAKLKTLGFIFTPTVESWNSRYVELVEFKNKHGHCDVRERDNQELAEWVTQQRGRKKRGRFSTEQLAKLNALEFIWNTRDAGWDKMFADLSAFEAIYHHCNVPARWPENKRLGDWVAAQRTDKKKDQLSADQIAQLTSVGFSWDRFDDKWERSFRTLIDYKKKYGNCNVPQKWEKDPSLGKWVGGQRIKWRDGTLTQDHVKRLEELNFAWRPKKL